MESNLSEYTINKFSKYNNSSEWLFFDSIVDKNDKLHLVKKINIKKKENNINSSNVYFPKIIEVPYFDNSSLSLIDYFIEKNLKVINLCVDYKFDLNKLSESTSLTISEIKNVINDLIKRIKEINNKAIEDEIKKIINFQKILFLNDIPIKRNVSKKYYFIYLYFDPESNYKYDKYLNAFIETANNSFKNIFGLNSIVNEITISKNELYDNFPFHKDLISRVLYYLSKDKYILKVHNNKYKVTSNIEYIDDELISILDNFDLRTKEILEDRIVKDKTLQEIGEELNLTRERVRQIENSTLKKFRFFLNYSFVKDIKDYLAVNKYIQYEQIPIQNSKLKTFYVKIISDKRFNMNIIYDKHLNALIGSSLNSYNNIKMGFLKYYDSVDKRNLTKEDLDLFLKSFPHSLPNKFIIKVFLEKGFLMKFDNMFLLMERFKSGAEKVTFMYELRKSGYCNNEIDLLRSDLDKYFPNEFVGNSDRNIFSLALNSNQIVLWDWGGSYIHKKYLNDIIDKFDFTDVIDYMYEVFNTQDKIDLEHYYEKNKEQLMGYNIPNKYALHSLLREEFDDLFEFHKSPWVAQKGTKKEFLTVTLYTNMGEDRVYSLNEILKKLQTKSFRIQQLVDRSKNIVSTDNNFYIRKELVDLPDDLYQDIVDFICTKLDELEFFYVDLIIDKFRERLNILSDYNIRVLLIELLKKNDTYNHLYKITHNRIYKNDFIPTLNNTNFQYAVCHFLLDNRDKVTFNELFEFFIIRGLSNDRIMHYYFHSKRTSNFVIRLNKNFFYSNSSLGINFKTIAEVNNIIYEKLENEMQIDDLLEEISSDFPKINAVWTKFLVSDLLDRTKFNVYPNLTNPLYISRNEEY